jgi:hypothetical protein
MSAALASDTPSTLTGHDPHDAAPTPILAASLHWSILRQEQALRRFEYTSVS